MTEESWGLARGELLKALGKNNFQSWIEPLRLAGLSEGVATFDAPTKFMRDWVSRNYLDKIAIELGRAGVSVSRVEIAVSDQRPAPAAAAPTAVPMAEQARRRAQPEELPGAPLDQRFTFDTFVVGKPNELAHAAARRVAEGGPVSFNPLFFCLACGS